MKSPKMWQLCKITQENLDFVLVWAFEHITSLSIAKKPEKVSLMRDIKWGKKDARPSKERVQLAQYIEQKDATPS